MPQLSELYISPTHSLLVALRRRFLLGAMNNSPTVASVQKEGNSVGNLKLLRISKVRFRERKDIRYSMTSLFSALHGTGKSVVFIITGCKEKAAIYLGTWGSVENLAPLRSTIKGFAPGTEFVEVEDDDCVLSSIEKYNCVSAIVGVPSEKQAFQDEKRTSSVEFGIERFVDAMTEEHYAVVITATPVKLEDADLYFEKVSSCLNYTHRLAKSSLQISEGIQRGDNSQISENIGKTFQRGTQESTTEGGTNAPWLLKRWAKGVTKFVAGGDDPIRQAGSQRGVQTSEAISEGRTESHGNSFSKSENRSETTEEINHQAVYAEELLKLIHNRLKTGMGEGLWKTGVLVLGEKSETVARGVDVLKGMWAGASSHQDPIKSINLSELKGQTRLSVDQALALVCSPLVKDHPLGDAYSGCYTWMTSGELAIEANLPYYELPSLSSEPIVEYGRFLPTYDREKQLELGTLIDRNIKTENPVWMDTSRLNRHLFVTGLTGAGKSNTVRSTLLELARLGIPFLVVEPVKSEYRLLDAELRARNKRGESKFDHLDIFSLAGNGSDRLVLNPFAFEVRPGEEAYMGTALVSHIDRLKAVFNSSLGMYSSMPYILEEMIYKAYTNAGWDIETGRNKYLEEARKYLKLEASSELRNLFLPTLSDLSGLVDDAIKSFFPDKSDYGVSLIGALKSRLNSLSRGVKGQLLNQRLSLPIQSLLSRPCVVELEAFADNDEKAFVMALLLSRIYEFRAGKLENELKHVLVIEEAHRLLAKPPQVGEYSSNSRGKSVEVFSDMLAEIRAYGQGIIIADQIPSKLIPDVIKNTDVKIVHRLTAKEDRESVGTAMNLTEKQIEDLNRATPGLATVSFDGLNSAIRVQMKHIPIDNSESAKRKINVGALDAMAEYKQNIFLPKPDKEVHIPEEQERKRSLWLVIRLFFISAIYAQSDRLLGFKGELTEATASKRFKRDFQKLWPCVAEGAHALLSCFIDYGIPPGEAGRVVSAFVGFAKPWALDHLFTDEMNRFVDVARKNICFGEKGEGESSNYLDLLLQIYADNNDFQKVIAEKLRDGTDFQELLGKCVEDLTCKKLVRYDLRSLCAESAVSGEDLSVDDKKHLELYLKLLKCVKSDDEEIAKRAGRAYGSLMKWMPGENKTIVSARWEE